MSTSTDIAAEPMPIRKYELGRPIIRREQRIAFERIHRAVAQVWSDSMQEYLPRGAALEFEGLDFGSFASVTIDKNPCAQAAMFSIGSESVSGFVMMSGTLAKFLVTNRLGLKSSTDDAAVSLTRIETAIARETIRAMLARLRDEYTSARLGSIANIRECENLADSLAFAPDDYLALLGFRMSGLDDEMHVLIGLSGNVVNALSQPRTNGAEASNNRGAIIDAVAQLPIEVDIVLGSWMVPLSELLGLRAGDRIVLPEGEDAWLAARGIQLRRASVEITQTGARAEILRSAR
jgi:flagellar motor switch protein FliM